jgi:S-DNA-T family DNA segregation ATPase FtsK/SpoIIIE
MSQDKKSPPGKKQKTDSQPSTAIQEPETGWLDRLAGFWLRFDRFGWDLLGVILLVASIVTLLGLLGMTRGALITPWVLFLRRWMGWGSFFAAALAGYMGVKSLLRRFSDRRDFDLGKVLALEGLVFTLLALLTLQGGQSLLRVEQGLDGGQIGWGLVEIFRGILPAPVDLFLLIFLLVFFAFYGLGLFQWTSRRLESWMIHETPQRAARNKPEAVNDEEPGQVEENKPRTKNTAAKKPKREPAPAAEKPVNPAVRRSESLPPLNLLMNEQTNRPDDASIHNTALRIEHTLSEFGIPSRVVGFRVGPTVTQFAVEPGFIDKEGPDGEIQRHKVRVSQISGLARDLALALSAERLRIEAPVPGQSFVGIEVPNEKSSVVRLRPLLESPEFQRLQSPLSLALGKDVSGKPVVADLARMPHLLISGTTGSGKSVCIVALTICLVMNNTPDELRLTMLDPKMVELLRFNGLPHLLHQVETEPLRMLGVLQWALVEMDNRYRLLEAANARDLETYNRRMERKKQPTLPRIVIIIDELADLMMTSPEQTEHSLVRLAQLARATGIHLIVATQRPSTDVVTGLIKANFPARISFNVSSSIDSRVILDTNGAETLLGRGDMLFLDPEVGSPLRAQGAMITDQEMERVIKFWQKMSPDEENPAPWEDMLQQVHLEGEDAADELVQRAIDLVRESQRASISLLQRRLRIGYPRAARLIDELEELGVIGPSQTGGREREVLLPPEGDEDGTDVNDGDEEEAEDE